MANPIYKQIFQIHLELQLLPYLQLRMAASEKNKRQVSALIPNSSSSSFQQF